MTRRPAPCVLLTLFVAPLIAGGASAQRIPASQHGSVTQRVGYTAAYISRLEAGERQPSIRVLRKLADELGVDPHYLETGHEDPLLDALREIADVTVKPRDLEEAVVTNLQKVRIDEEDETEELASLSEAAEALRLTAAAPPRPTPSGGDYE